jgi:hypothetical protein
VGQTESGSIAKGAPELPWSRRVPIDDDDDDIPSDAESSSKTRTGTGPYNPQEIAALPGLNLINQAVLYLKEQINNGERGCSCAKTGAYLAFRVISYSFIPLALNIVSIIICAILCLLTLPLACCNPAPLNWSWHHLKGSATYTLMSLFDLTCDFRQLTGRCCCDPDGTYLRI